MTAADINCVADLVTQLGYPATAVEIARRFTRLDGGSIGGDPWSGRR
jgi:hypothetical protein